jgi:hypothetical protein
MTVSTAKLAQGAALEIAGTPGSSITITGITKATPAVVTATNTLAVGDVVVFGTVTGMPEINGRIGIVTVASGTSFTVNIDASGFAAAGTGGTATQQTWTKVSNAKDFNGFGGAVSKIDVSNLDSVAMEYKPGLEDFGTVTGTVDLSGADAGQIAMQVAKSTQASTYFRITYPSASVKRAWAGFVVKFDEAGSVNNVLKSTFELQITGRVSRTEVVV